MGSPKCLKMWLLCKIPIHWEAKYYWSWFIGFITGLVWHIIFYHKQFANQSSPLFLYGEFFLTLYFDPSLVILFSPFQNFVLTLGGWAMVIFNIFFSHSTIFHEASTEAGLAFSTLEAFCNCDFKFTWDDFSNYWVPFGTINFQPNLLSNYFHRFSEEGAMSSCVDCELHSDTFILEDWWDMLSFQTRLFFWTSTW